MVSEKKKNRVETLKKEKGNVWVNWILLTIDKCGGLSDCIFSETDKIVYAITINQESEMIKNVNEVAKISSDCLQT